MDRFKGRSEDGNSSDIGNPRVANLHAVECKITREEISILVDTFYARVWVHPRLGPIFSSRLDDNREAHLDRMKQFWASVLLRTGEYHGRPVPKHKAITEVQGVDFAHWLELFRTTANEVLQPDVAQFTTKKAEQIAQSLWLAMFGRVGESPPTWLKGPNYLFNHAQSELRESVS